MMIYMAYITPLLPICRAMCVPLNNEKPFVTHTEMGFRIKQDLIELTITITSKSIRLKPVFIQKKN